MTESIQSVESIDRAAKVNTTCPECGARSVHPCLVQVEGEWSCGWWCQNCNDEVRVTNGNGEE